MPAEYQIDQAQGLVLSRAWGVLQREHLIGHGERLRADPDFKPHYRQLWDLTEITKSELSYTELTAMAKISVFAPASRRAMLAPVDVVFGMARMFQMLKESEGETGIRVFRKRSEALRWLETGEDPAPPPRGSSPP
jgi:hypothetical protein